MPNLPPNTPPVNDLMVTYTGSQLRELVRDGVAEALSDAAPTPALVDSKGLAQALSCSPAMVKGLLKKGCPHTRLGCPEKGNPRFSILEVVDWMRSR